ncbi:MAG: hypothetical protein LBE12_14330 [Planctomycetaceae bacterium]|nr:hypothetical protein [Planctomycetaceae bacterium]
MSITRFQQTILDDISDNVINQIHNGIGIPCRVGNDISVKYRLTRYSIHKYLYLSIGHYRQIPN